MKKLLLAVAALMLIVYAMPMVTVGFSAQEDEIYGGTDAVLVDATGPTEATEPAARPTEAPVQESPQSLVSYDKKTYITVLVGGEPQTLSLHDYLVGVVAAEMPANFPEEALKAQALAARTYSLYKIKLYEDGMDIPDVHKGAQLCDDYTHCKAYCDIAVKGAELWGGSAAMYTEKITKAVESTCGLIAVYDGQPIAAVFHAASGDYTEAAVDVWGGDVPYLVSVPTSGGEESSRFYSEVTISQSDFAARVKEKYPEASFPADAGQWFKASSRSQAGGIIDVAVGGVRVPGTFIRQIAGLNSTNFKVRVDGDKLVFTSTGYGHGVGMSQYGAKALALEGKTFDQIIKHYFTGVELLLKS